MKRTIPGLLLAAIWLVLLLFGSAPLFATVMVAVVAVAGYEYVKMIAEDSFTLFSRIYLTVTLIIPTLVVALGHSKLSSGSGVFFSFLFISLYFIFRYNHGNNSYEQFARMVLGAVYIGVLASHLVMLRYLPQGGNWLIILAAITAGSDSGAYYCGSMFGKHKLCPGISPKKTVEGALGGLICGVATSLIAAALLLKDTNWLFLLGAAILLTGVGIIGDLAESIIKRGTGTKDSSRLLAGHGGVLDRIDSMLLAGPVLYYLLLFIGMT